MNAKQRKEIEGIISQLEDAQSHVDCIRDDEDEKYYNMPEGIQDSERGESFLDAIEQLDGAYDSIGDAIDYLREILG